LYFKDFRTKGTKRTKRLSNLLTGFELALRPAGGAVWQSQQVR
jgi:hypothetical protein